MCARHAIFQDTGYALNQRYMTLCSQKVKKTRSGSHTITFSNPLEDFEIHIPALGSEGLETPGFQKGTLLVGDTASVPLNLKLHTLGFL